MPAESAVRLQTHEKEEEQPCKPPMSDMSPPPLLPGSPKVPPRAPITGTISSPPLQMRSTRRLAPVHRARHLRASDPGRVEENVVANRAEVGELETRYRAGGLGDTTLERRLEGVLESLLAPMHAGRSEMAEDPGVVGGASARRDGPHARGSGQRASGPVARVQARPGVAARVTSDIEPGPPSGPP